MENCSKKEKNEYENDINEIMKTFKEHKVKLIKYN